MGPSLWESNKLNLYNRKRSRLIWNAIFDLISCSSGDELQAGVWRGAKENQRMWGAPEAGHTGTDICTWSLGLTAEDEETGLGNLKCSLWLSDFMIKPFTVFLIRQKKKTNLLFTVHSNTNSKELTKNCQVFCFVLFLLLLMWPLHFAPPKIITFWGRGIRCWREGASAAPVKRSCDLGRLTKYMGVQSEEYRTFF